MKKYGLWFIIFFEIGSIVFIYNQNKKILHRPNIEVLQKESFVFPKDPNLQHFYELQPSLTKKDKPDWLSYTAVNTINNDGMNERFDYLIEKPINTYRILTIGDSYTYGLYVNTPENWSERLEDMLNHSACGKTTHFEVINLGVPGYDLQYQVIHFQNTGLKYKPDLVIWFVSDGDLVESYEFVAKELERARYLLAHPDEIPDTSVIDPFLKEWSLAYFLFQKKYKEQEIVAMQRAYLDTFSLSYQGPLVMLNFCCGLRWDRYGWVYKQFIERRRASYYFPYISGFEKLSDGHPSSLGHKKIAELVYTYITKLPSVLCSNIINK